MGGGGIVESVQAPPPHLISRLIGGKELRLSGDQMRSEVGFETGDFVKEKLGGGYRRTTP